MIVFNNQQRSGYEEIASYSPFYYRNIREMDAIFHLEGWLVDLMAKDMENMIAYQFLKNMDEESLTRYEIFLGVARNMVRTLNERKSYIYAMLIGAGKLSACKIERMVNQFPGCVCDYIVLVESTLHVSIVIIDELNIDIRDIIHELIKRKIPAHINADISFDNVMLGRIYFGSFMKDADILEIRQR